MQMRQEQIEQTALDIDTKVVEKLSSKKAEERVWAEQQLEQLGPQQIDALMATLQAEGRKRRKRKRLGYTIFYGYLGVVLLVVGVYVAHGMITGHYGKFPSALFNFFTYCSGIFGAAAASQVQKNAATRLAQFDDKRAVGPLAEALTFEDKNVQAVARDALTRLLPRLNASDAPLLNEEQRNELNKALKTRQRHDDFLIAILKAYEQIGDSKALPFVESLAKGEGRAEKSLPVREAAIACLPALRERAERERAAQTLLRPATSPDNPSEFLLRPAQGASEVDPDTLLRPSSAEETA